MRGGRAVRGGFKVNINEEEGWWVTVGGMSGGLGRGRERKEATA